MDQPALVKFKTVLFDKDRKPLLLILKEVIHCKIREKEWSYYFASILYKKGTEDYRNFIGIDKIYKLLIEKLIPNGHNLSLENKLNFNEILVKNEIPTPVMLCHNEGNVFYIGDVQKNIGSIKEFKSLLKELVNHSKSQSLFIKPIDGLGGHNAFKIDEGEIQNESKISKIFETIRNSSCLFQETLNQHDQVNNIYSKSINTIRVHSYYDKNNNTVEIVSALMRFGSQGNVVDNGSAGGLFVSVDHENWKLIGAGKSYLRTGGKTFPSHPDTGTIFNGKEIPFGEEIHSIIDKVARQFSSPFVGWDVAITQNGPVIVEGNGDPHLIMAQMACGGFRNHPRYSQLFAEYL